MPFPNPKTQFQKGNPGRPKGRGLADRMRAFLERGEINGKPIKDGRQVADMLVEVIFREALSGNYRFTELIVDRVDGKLGSADAGDGATAEVETLRDFLASVPTGRRRKPRRVLGGDPGPDGGVQGPHDAP